MSMNAVHSMKFGAATEDTEIRLEGSPSIQESIRKPKLHRFRLVLKY
jgi:hypothetical protein